MRASVFRAVDVGVELLRPVASLGDDGSEFGLEVVVEAVERLESTVVLTPRTSLTGPRRRQIGVE
ncbi:MAG: hypothetical protein ABEJ78_11175 [Haloferacaceae archaeon]